MAERSVVEGKEYSRGTLPLPPPDDTICLQIEIPNDTRWIAAYLGQVDRLARWIIWDRDEDHTAIKIADIWREIAQTIKPCRDLPAGITCKSSSNEIYLDCEDDMPIYINYGCGCGCGSGSGSNRQPYGVDSPFIESSGSFGLPGGDPSAYGGTAGAVLNQISLCKFASSVVPYIIEQAAQFTEGIANGESIDLIPEADWDNTPVQLLLRSLRSFAAAAAVNLRTAAFLERTQELTVKHMSDPVTDLSRQGLVVWAAWAVMETLDYPFVEEAVGAYLRWGDIRTLQNWIYTTEHTCDADVLNMFDQYGRTPQTETVSNPSGEFITPINASYEYVEVIRNAEINVAANAVEELFTSAEPMWGWYADYSINVASMYDRFGISDGTITEITHETLVGVGDYSRVRAHTDMALVDLQAVWPNATSIERSTAADLFNPGDIPFGQVLTLNARPNANGNEYMTLKNAGYIRQIT